MIWIPKQPSDENTLYGKKKEEDKKNLLAFQQPQFCDY